VIKAKAMVALAKIEEDIAKERLNIAMSWVGKTRPQ
jgi:hypothetical protein